MRQTLKIVDMPPNLNEYRNMHYRKLDKLKKEWAVKVRAQALIQGIQPVDIIHQTYEFYFKDRREHDPDNYACCAKFINDGLVACGILPRDNFNVIKEFIVKQGGICPEPYILIHLQEVGA